MNANNSLHLLGLLVTPKSITDDLNLVKQRFLIYLPLIFFILGLVGFLGNAFTYLQPELRSNTCSIYSLCGSIVDIVNLSVNSLPNFVNNNASGNAASQQSRAICKIKLFALVFLPHLSINFLLMAIIDRFASTCKLQSPMKRITQIKVVPWMILMTILTSVLATFFPAIFYEVIDGIGCVSTQPNLNSIVYIILCGLMQPLFMLIFVLLTYWNVRQSQRHVGRAAGTQRRSIQNQFVVMIIAQVFVTAFFSIQWIILYMYFSFTSNNVRTYQEFIIVMFVFSVTNNCYYINNFKAFYISLMTSRLFRKTFLGGLIKLLPRHVRARWDRAQTVLGISATISTRRRDLTKS